MPVTPVEIMLAKMTANALVIMAAAVASLVVVVEWALGVPVAGSLLLFVLGTAIYAFAVAALGILLGTWRRPWAVRPARHPGLRGHAAALRRDDADGEHADWLQWMMRIFSPTPHFVAFSQGVLYRGAGLDVVWPEIAKIMAIGWPISPVALAASGRSSSPEPRRTRRPENRGAPRCSGQERPFGAADSWVGKIIAGTVSSRRSRPAFERMHPAGHALRGGSRGAGQGFGYEDVVERAKALAGQPFDAASATIPASCRS